jgi:hypothetical protein
LSRVGLIYPALSRLIQDEGNALNLVYISLAPMQAM